VGAVPSSGLELLDVFGPLEMFGLLERKAQIPRLAELPGAVKTSQGPKVDPIAQVRRVEDGKFFTTAGVSAGMEMAHALIARLFGKEKGVAIARDARYEWRENAGGDPFAKLNGLT
jgi:hypothetical protein